MPEPLKITQPTLLIDKERCMKNIFKMAKKASKSEVLFRPHFKTHQSRAIGEWYKAAGVKNITVSSVTMAAYFAGEWEDITIAIPFNIREIDAVNKLMISQKLILMVDNPNTARFLAQNLENECSLWVEIDTGSERTGIDTADTETLDATLEVIRQEEKLTLKGFYSHAGHSYACHGEEEIMEVYDDLHQKMMDLRNKYIIEWPHLEINIGDTPCCSRVKVFEGIDSISPGNFVFYDLSQEQIGACSFDQIAVALACPIVAIHEERNEIVIYGGGIHFSKERLEDENSGTIFGRVAENKGNAWGNVIPKMFVKGLSQEHGIVSVPDSRLGNYKIGDILMILPVHSCLTANLTGSYTTIGGETIGRFRF